MSIISQLNLVGGSKKNKTTNMCGEYLQTHITRMFVSALPIITKIGKNNSHVEGLAYV